MEQDVWEEETLARERIFLNLSVSMCTVCIKFTSAESKRSTWSIINHYFLYSSLSSISYPILFPLPSSLILFSSLGSGRPSLFSSLLFSMPFYCNENIIWSPRIDEQGILHPHNSLFLTTLQHTKRNNKTTYVRSYFKFSLISHL